MVFDFQQQIVIDELIMPEQVNITMPTQAGDIKETIQFVGNVGTSINIVGTIED